MQGVHFTKRDRQQMDSLGITEAQVIEQIEIFRKADFFVHLHRPCTLEDGVHTISSLDADRYLLLHEQAAREGRFLKFVPASGAATRMFQSLLQIYYMPHFLEVEELHHRAEQGVAVACDFLRFLGGLRQFPFLDDLKQAMMTDGFSLDALLRQCEFRVILDYLLTKRGLNYGTLPKALLKFHRYPDECRTAFEEHLAESAQYMDNGCGRCRVHFTVSAEHEQGFRELMERVGSLYEARFRTSYEIEYSFQKTSTNTVAVDMKNRLFRDRYGRIHFRPGGHGALLENLNDLHPDLVYIKNIDNLVPDRLKAPVVLWKKILGGCLVDLQDRVHALLRDLTRDPGSYLVDRGTAYCREVLMIPFPFGFEGWSVDRKREFIIGKLDRPIRVCGVVRNRGEPGGAPFWVKGRDGEHSIQIVEKAQVDFESEEQRSIWMSSTHFNPVDLVCGLRDYRGNPFDLRRHVDKDAVFISRKSKDGRDLKALELPGLWNGSMADWITYIVEVPGETFNPVKSVYDLLRPNHQV